jgi:hypothetical protein
MRMIFIFVVIASLIPASIPARAQDNRFVCALDQLFDRVPLCGRPNKSNCDQILPMSEYHVVLVLPTNRPVKDWTYVRTRNRNSLLVDGWVLSRFLCPCQVFGGFPRC